VTLARLMIAFAGAELPPSAAERIKERGIAGRSPVARAGLSPRGQGLTSWG